MGIFSSIKDAILGQKKDGAAATSTQTGTTRAPTPTPAPTAWAKAPVTEKQAVSGVDVEQRLDSMPGADRLNWRTSIVDLMKLIGVDPSYENRKELAGELGRPDYSGSAEDNIWLHKRTMQELAANGGTVPAEFRD